jgi:ribose 5-phosphate isomerase RpiB
LLDANVLALGARVLGDDLAAEIARAWLSTGFANDERGRRLVQRIERFEETFEDERQAATDRPSAERS